VADCAPYLPDRWLHSSSLQLHDPLAKEWDAFASSLNSAGISLSNEQDTLLWAGGDGSGSLSVRNVYEALLHSQNFTAESPGLLKIWKWSLPLKILLFFWLCTKNRILTWEALRRRGWQGPGLCLLCKHNTEDLDHLMVHCSFTINCWNRLSRLLPLQAVWNGVSFTDCLDNWLAARSAPHPLVAHVCWQIWLERNQLLFEGRPPSCDAVIHRILSSFHWKLSSIKDLHVKPVYFSLDPGSTIICFDGAAQANGHCCGAGGTLKTHSSRVTKWFMNCGDGSNTKAELNGFMGLSLSGLQLVTKPLTDSR
jgi:hypothetical protein